MIILLLQTKFGKQNYDHCMLTYNPWALELTVTAMINIMTPCVAHYAFLLGQINYRIYLPFNVNTRRHVVYQRTKHHIWCIIDGHIRKSQTWYQQKKIGYCIIFNRYQVCDFCETPKWSIMRISSPFRAMYFIVNLLQGVP